MRDRLVVLRLYAFWIVTAAVIFGCSNKEPLGDAPKAQDPTSTLVSTNVWLGLILLFFCAMLFGLSARDPRNRFVYFGVVFGAVAAVFVTRRLPAAGQFAIMVVGAGAAGVRFLGPFVPWERLTRREAEPGETGKSLVGADRGTLWEDVRNAPRTGIWSFVATLVIMLAIYRLFGMDYLWSGFTPRGAG